MPLKREIGALLGVGLAAVVIFGPWWWRPANPCVAGDLTARAQAQVPDAFKEIYLDAQRMQFGLGSAAVGGWDGLGDALAVGGVVWVRTTNAHSPQYYGTIGNRYFQSNGFVYLAPGRMSASNWQPMRPTTLAQWWEALSKENPAGVMFAGYARLAPLRLIAIARPATEGRLVLKNAPYYYTRPMESATQAWAFVVGIAATGAATSWPDRDWLASLLAVHPGGDAAAVGLAYALWLKSPPGDFQTPPKRSDVGAVGQLVADTTVVEADLKLYPVTRAGDCGAVARTR